MKKDYDAIANGEELVTFMAETLRDTREALEAITSEYESTIDYDVGEEPDNSPERALVARMRKAIDEAGEALRQAGG